MMKLALGCVQFGLAYGVTNKMGQVPLTEIEKILACAKQVGINTLDTAAAYGNSEQILGQLALTNSFDIVTKIPTLSNGDTQSIHEIVTESLAKLNVQCLKALMFHNADDLLTSNGSLYYQGAKQFKADQTIAQLGISVYHVQQLSTLLNQFSFDIVQLPANWLDQRFLTTKLLNQLSNKHIEVHARSLFLQGILIQPFEELPDYFLPFKAWIMAFHALCQRCNCQPLTLALALIHLHPMIDKAVVGCCSLQQLEEIIEHYQKAEQLTHQYHELLTRVGANIASDEQELINPSLWSI
ncbi:aldo/keto reductase [Thalassotalea castellviae]|uniref:Aldo/keto reductase n=1 Tax=Thalassotalea castellviae TaxID=3075612 RepID=A0ABU2ZY52_9GAMM|nr:aldo/keto reductase [Thalassotalea sp. W431]MDT0602856.1 aldo/keto reductase [Thalassotalea sp. W431]